MGFPCCGIPIQERQGILWMNNNLDSSRKNGIQNKVITINSQIAQIVRRNFGHENYQIEVHSAEISGNPKVVNSSKVTSWSSSRKNKDTARYNVLQRFHEH